ncbi:hypothetical protein HGRIS_014029 [Hohenbuehelia grisea]|uniref:Uncharacterized protein n=1 Tax=Hohenbuehelia grisea TaxID=104357 RepID=A0ABR3JTJ0_9AGAR
MIDPLSLASSILAIVDPPYKLRRTFYKALENDQRARQIRENVIRELDQVENICRLWHTTWGIGKAEDAKCALTQLRDDLISIQEQCEMYLAAERDGTLKSLLRRFKAWLKQSATESEIYHLERSILSCLSRFTVFSLCRTEFNLVISHQENLDRLQHIEALISHMLIQNARSYANHPKFLDKPEEVDFAFLHRQIRRILDNVDRVSCWWGAVMEPPPQEYIATVEDDPKSNDVISFRKTLSDTLHASQMMSSTRGCTRTELAVAVWTVTTHASVLNGWGSQLGPFMRPDLLKMAEYAADLFHHLNSANNCDIFEHFLACCRYRVSVLATALCLPRAPFLAEASLNAWQARYEKQRDRTNLLYLLAALCQHNVNLRHNNQLEEALDYSRQALLPLRTSPETEIRARTVVTWDASGESDVVFSPQRRFSRSYLVAAMEAKCIWHMALGLASIGRYAEARVAGMDAVSCHEAIYRTYPRSTYASQSLDWITVMRDWVTIVSNPSSSCDVRDDNVTVSSKHLPPSSHNRYVCEDLIPFSKSLNPAVDDMSHMYFNSH